jgi:hypothetical protein
VNINVSGFPAGEGIIGYAFDVYVNPDVLEVGYDYDGPGGVPPWYWTTGGSTVYFLYNWASTNAPFPYTVVVDPDTNATAGTMIGCQEVVYGWKDFSVVKGASGTGLLAYFYFKTLNSTPAYSPIIIKNAEYWTYTLGSPDNIKESHPINDTMVHYGTPIHEVSVDSVWASASTINRGDNPQVRIRASNLGGFTETFTAATYYNKTASTWEPMGVTFDFTLDPLDMYVEKGPEFWGTDEVEPGNYTIKANATVAGDVNGTNNDAITTIEVEPPLYDLAVTAMSVNLTSPFIGDIVEINVTAAVLNAHFANGTLDSVNFTVTAEYDNGVIGEDNATLVTEGQTRNFTIYWDTAGVLASTPGNYTIEAYVTLWTESGWDDTIEFNDAQLIEVLVRIPGDVNNDGIVDIYDVGAISAHWTPAPAGPQGYNILVDINHDGNIDIDDMEIVSAHWGETL